MTQTAAAAYRLPEDGQVGSGPVGPLTCHSNNETWELILYNGLKRSDVPLTLDSFFIFEWFPRSPGLFHTAEGIEARQLAQYSIAQVVGGTVIYNPYGKACMLDGGVGNVRFQPLEISGQYFYLMTASSSGTCHEGFPLAVPESIYNGMIDEIKVRGSVVKSVTGRLRFVPERIRSFFADVREVPQLYLVVDSVNPPRHPKSRHMEELRVSVAISFVSGFEGKPRVYASYVSFNPGDSRGLSDAVEWLEHDYVYGRYRGNVITDFDEQTVHFRNAPFSLEKVMGLRLTEAEIVPIENVIGIDANGVLRQQVTIHKEIYMEAKYKITGGQQGAVGDYARADHFTFTQLWNGVSESIDLVALADGLSRLRAEARQESTKPEHDEAIGAIAAAEGAARKGDGPTALQQLAKAGKWALDVATRVGVSVAAAALAHALGQK